MDFEVGQAVGDYEILALLGAGGMGKVYKVRNTLSERVEAMKVLLARLDEHPELVDRFSREIKVTAALDHPNITALRTAQRFGNQLAMIMEYVEGSTLDTLMRGGAMPLAQVLEIVNQSLSALAYAHSLGLVHRDIKPANIMVTPEGRVKLMDFGIARMSADRSLTKTGQMVGSLYYMSPEQVEGKSLDARSDLYSLGVTLYELVTGKKPFDGDSDYAILAGHLHQPPRPPIEISASVPEGLNEIILMALAKDPVQRFQSAPAFRAALNAVATELGIPLSAPAEGASSSRGSSSKSSLVGADSTAGMESTDGTPNPPTPRPMADTVALPAQAATPQPAAAPPPYQGPVNPQPQYAQSSQIPPPPVYDPNRKSNWRALWMVAGALAMLAILGAGVIYLPKLRKANAQGEQKASTSTVTTPAPQTPPETAQQPATPTQEPVVSQPSSSTPQASPSTEHTAVEHASAAHRPSTAAAQTQPATQTSAPPTHASDETRPAEQPQQPIANAQQPQQGTPNQEQNTAELEKLQEELDMLGSRAGAVKSSLDNLQRQQAAQGYGLRGDIVASQQRMDTLLGQVQSKIQRGDIDGAKKSLSNAESEVSKLEKFLGR